MIKPIPSVLINSHRNYAILFAFVFLFISFILKFNFNPDWYIYEEIFINGSHLKKTGRDIGFVWLNEFFKLFSTNYLLFRFSLTLFFSCFFYYLFRGKIYNFKFQTKKQLFSIFIFVFAFLLIRFTVQIREGLAICFVISALGIMNKSVDAEKNIGNQLLFKKILAIIFFLIALFIHSGTTIFFGVYVVSLIINRFYDSALKIYKSYTWLFWSFLVILLLFSLNFYKLLQGHVYFLNHKEQIKPISYDITKVIYWAINGIFSYFLIKKINDSLSLISNKSLKIYGYIISKYLLSSVFLLIVTSIFMNESGGFIALLSRLFGVTTFIAMMILCFNNIKEYRFVFYYSAYLLIDQLRTVHQSLTEHQFI